MGNFNRIVVRDWSQGLATDPDAKDLSPGWATLAENCDLSVPGKLGKSRGIRDLTVNGASLPAEPTNLVIDSFKQFHVTLPSDKDVQLISGTLSGARKFYISPWYDSYTTGGAAAWTQASWLDLTEKYTTTIDTYTSDTNFTLAAGSNAVNDYYKGWYIFNSNTGRVSIIYDYVASTRQVLLTNDLTGSLAAHSIMLVRAPIWNQDFTANFQIDTLPAFEVHGEICRIYTGNHNPNSGPDLQVSFISRSFFDDNNHDFAGFQLEHASNFPCPVTASTFGTWANVNETSEPLPYISGQQDHLILQAVFLYDGFQESQIFFDNDTLFLTTGTSQTAVAITDDTSKVTVNVTLYPFLDFYRTSAWEVDTANQTYSRRITRLLIYGALGRAVTTPVNSARSTTPFFLLHDINIDDTNFSASGGTGYVYALTVSGKHWSQGQKREYTLNTGHDIEKVGGNAKQGLQVGGNWVSGPVYLDQKYPDVVSVAPVAGVLVGGAVTPSSLVKSIAIQTRDAGVYEVIALAEQQGRLLIFGKNTFAVAQVNGQQTQIIEQFQKRGIVSNRGVQIINNVAYYCGIESIYAFDGGIVRDIADKRIRKDWAAISLANREACFTGSNLRLKEFYIKVGSTLFVYNTLQQNWKTETLDVTWTYFGNGVNGELIGTDGSNLYELDASSYTTTRGLHWKSHAINTKRVRPRRFRASWSGTDTVTVNLYDSAVSTTVPRETLYLLSGQSPINEKISFEGNEVIIELQSTSSINDDLEITEIELAEKSREER